MMIPLPSFASAALSFALFLPVVFAQNHNKYKWAICHPLMNEYVYSRDASISTSPSATGAIGVNKEWEDGSSTEYFIEQQRAGADWIAAGICGDVVVDEPQNMTQIDIGSLILNFGFDLQSVINGGFPDSGDAVHSTSLFLEAAARAAYLLKKNGHRPAHREWRPDIERMALYMIDPAVTAPGASNNLAPFNHRYFLRAAGVQAASVLSKDVNTSAVLATAARDLVVQGLALQRTNGIMPERNGFDFNYQAIGVGYLAKYFSLAKKSLSQEEKRAIRKAIKKSLPLFVDRVDRLGNVDLRDSTRINEDSRSGRPKSLDTKNIIQAFLASYNITNREDYFDLATKIANPTRPIVEYIFDRPDSDGQPSSGTDDDAGDLFARTSDNAKDSTPLGAVGSGLTGASVGEFPDYAYNMTSADSMGTDNTDNGPFARTDGNVDSLDGLLSFTMTGWYRTANGDSISNNIELFKTNTMKLTAVNSGKLRLYVDDENVIATNADWAVANEWAFFAVSYDGSATVNNVKFYHATPTAGVQLSSTHTLDKGAVDKDSSRLYINRQDRSFNGFLDNMRIYGSKTDASGALSSDLVSDLQLFDTRTLETSI